MPGSQGVEHPIDRLQLGAPAHQHVPTVDPLSGVPQDPPGSLMFRDIPDVAGRGVAASVGVVPTFLLCHRHAAKECRFAYAAWKGTESPLRHRPAVSSCSKGGHMVWWTVEAGDADDALAQLPLYVADRTDVFEVAEVPIP